MLIVILLQILFKHANGISHLVTAPHPISIFILIPWAELSWLHKEGGNSAKNTFGGRVAFCCIGTYSYHFLLFSVLLMDLSSWKELKTNFSADANNPNKLFYKYTTNSNTL